MPTYDWNIKTWGETYNWRQEGEEWSSAWGNSETQWFGTLLPRLHRFLPCENVLEIAPGFGRWTKFLLPLTIGRYVGVDISESCIVHCNEKYKSDNSSFFQNDGFSLKQVWGQKYDLIFSFDSLVHAEINILN
ncbi:MAG: class I SAM-dependent methyltransferase [Bacteroidales bacterium]|nr:class I SAM-dependent methyltransferase [Bacteroidales bacterium]